MSSKRFNVAVLALLVAFVPTLAVAGGPLLIFDASTDTPYAWSTAAPVDVYTDLGPFGPLTNAQGDAQVQFAISQWQGVATSALQLTNVGDFSLVPLPDVNDLATGSQVVGVENGGGIHVIYDQTGAVVFDLFGAPPGVLGIASPDFALGAEIIEGWVVLNGSTIDAADVNGDEWAGVITHEFGHSINLAHTQTNGAVGFFGDQRTPDGCPGPYDGATLFLDDLETMYPFIDPTPGTGTGTAQKTVEHLDDVAALSNLYPETGWPGDFATIEGQVFEADGVTPVTGVNVIVRNVADPFADSASRLSGDITQGALGPDGRFRFNGLTPGEEYVVYIDAIEAGGFSTTPTSLTFGEEWWNTNESSDGTIDPECDYSTIVAGGTSNADIILTDPGAVLSLGDDDFEEVPLGFSFPFCDGNVYTSVFVNSNGNLTFGSGDTDFSESVSELLSDQPRIAPLWDDLSPNAGGVVTAENVGGEFVVTFTNVPQFFDTDSNNFTVTLRPDGSYSIEYGQIDAGDAIIGRSAGNGAPDPGASDISGLAQPIGFGQQVVYEEFSVGPIDLANTSTDWTICELLPPAILAVDVTPISVSVAPDATIQATLDIGNAAVPPAQDLEWVLGAAGTTGSSVVVGEAYEARLFEMARSVDRGDGNAGERYDALPTKRADTAERLRAFEEARGPVPLQRAAGPNNVADGSFELGPFGGAWTEASSNFGTPICDALSCGTGTGTGPRTGLFWTWFGGISAFEAGSVSQNVFIPAGDVTLSFWIEQVVCDSASDYMSVQIDGTEVYRTDGGSSICGTLGYTQVTIDLAALGYADGAVHNVEFTSEIFAANGGGTNFFLDDVVIAEEIPECEFLTYAPGAGTTAAGGSTPVTLTFDATGYTPGIYTCEVSVSSNAGSAVVPVEMVVVDPTIVGVLETTDPVLAQACDDGYFYAALVPPDGTDPADVDPSGVLLNGTLAPDPGYSVLSNTDADPEPDALVVRFDCNDVSQLIGCGDDIALVAETTVAGGGSIVFNGSIDNGAVFPVVFGDSWDGIPLQDILDAEVGAGLIDAETDYEGAACGDAITPYWLDNQVESWIVREIAGYANQNTMGWYVETFDAPVIDGVDDGIIFTGSDGEGATELVTLGSVARFGLYLNPRGDGNSTNAPEPELFFTNRRYNDEGPDGSGATNMPAGGDPQALIYNITQYRDGVPTFIVAWEDLDYGSPITPSYTSSSTDNDFNDMVVEIRAASPVRAVVAGLQGQVTDQGVQLQWQITGGDLVDALEVHRTAPDGARSVAARFGRDELDRSAWLDTEAIQEGTYRYRIVARIGDSSVSSEEQTFVQRARALVAKSRFVGAVPNPFNPQTSFVFALSRSEEVKVSIFDTAGRLVDEMALGELNAGEHRVTWQGTDDSGKRVASGVYLVRMETPSARDGIRVVLLK